ncbi:hypothetical protein NW768_012164 [Fusarium equiseti]|uniref:Uncharacterized protein n=1 Tax=Fusarium equiseti TaxID=61235 RepID=A0ABQ8QW45_FUSEQ|nr:hypothetical protein NW768_012164 [Fusarium equiseti]
MKSSLKLLFALACTAIAPLVAAGDCPYKGNEAVCGDLGVMNVAPSDIPEGVLASEVRLCADHPNGGRDRELDPNKGASLAPLEEEKEVQPSPRTLFGRTCVLSAPYGCSERFCWKVCGKAGQWCWTAGAKGAGPWRGCHSWHDCGSDDVNYACGNNCRTRPQDCGCTC